ncbi:hypothetical protein NKJ16_24560 [Mesorhizobium sp. M0179]|uniref:hypothetical protein n=1 Tax=Mesorhizobium sp. M0179 TaxID=2956905 RepID=UPI00333DA3C0
MALARTAATKAGTGTPGTCFFLPQRAVDVKLDFFVFACASLLQQVHAQKGNQPFLYSS